MAQPSAPAVHRHLPPNARRPATQRHTAGVRGAVTGSVAPPPSLSLSRFFSPLSLARAWRLGRAVSPAHLESSSRPSGHSSVPGGQRKEFPLESSRRATTKGTGLGLAGPARTELRTTAPAAARRTRFSHHRRRPLRSGRGGRGPAAVGHGSVFVRSRCTTHAM